jgi:hypothetical protein
MRAGLKKLLILAGVWVAALAAAYAAQANPKMYLHVSMGDSYSAGSGNGPYDNAACKRSSGAWPRFIVPPYIDELACAGATIAAFYHDYAGQSAQLDVLRNDAAMRPTEPGSTWNSDIGAIKMVTLTIGGNDIGFAKVLTECFALTCLSDSQFAAVQIKIKNLKDRLAKLFAQIKATVPPDATVLVVGYPRIFPKDQKDSIHCGWLTRLERERLNFLTARLDLIEMEATEQAGVLFVNTFSALARHELCTKNSWMIPLGPKPYWAGGSGHPNWRGQKAIAATVQPQVPDFTYPGG